MMARNDTRLIEDLNITFAMYCDENDLSVAEGVDLAYEVCQSLLFAADDRASIPGVREELVVVHML